MIENKQMIQVLSQIQNKYNVLTINRWITLFSCNWHHSAMRKHPNGNWAPSDPVCRPKDIGQAAQLSRVYINHSVCATAITLWLNAGVLNRHIMAISGHRNKQSSAYHNTQVLRPLSLCNAAKSFPAVFKVHGLRFGSAINCLLQL